MATMNRSSGRNVLIFDHSRNCQDTQLLGGLIQNGSITEVNFLDMLGILLVVDIPYRVERRGDNHVVTRSGNPLQPGEYEVHCDSEWTVSP